MSDINGSEGGGWNPIIQSVYKKYKYKHVYKKYKYKHVYKKYKHVYIKYNSRIIKLYK
jgi:hypothetical protein